MAALVEWGTVGQITAESFAAGIVIVGAFALGARLLDRSTADGPQQRPTESRFAGLGIGVAVICFVVAAAAMAYGVWFTVDK